jgi:endonuclease-3
LGRKKIEKLIQKIGIFRVKAKSIYLMSRQVLEKAQRKSAKNL